MTPPTPSRPWSPPACCGRRLRCGNDREPPRPLIPAAAHSIVGPRTRPTGPGADEALAALYVHHQPADGYTLLLRTTSPLSADLIGAGARVTKLWTAWSRRGKNRPGTAIEMRRAKRREIAAMGQRLFSVLAAGATLLCLVATHARADVIDGDWCN